VISVHSVLLHAEINCIVKGILQVDLVEGFGEIKERIQRLISVEIPKLELCDVMSLKVKG